MYLQIKEISKKYNNKLAIQNISFDLEQGQLLCLLGHSGCGKSTILKAIGGFIRLDDGKIILDEKDITNFSPEERNISTVFQSYGLFPHMNVLSNIIYGLKFKNIKKLERKKLGLDMLKTIGLSGYENKSISELSGGEQQRIALARSLIVKPKLLLLDEPLSNLDASLKISMRKEIKKLQKDFKVTTILVTHDQTEAFEVADKIVLMNNGQIEQIGNALEIYNNPKTEFALNFIGVANRFDNSYVRPEKIFISHKNINSDGTEKKGIIEKIIFKGDLIEVVAKTDDKLLRIFTLNNSVEYRVGEQIFIEYQEEKLN